MERNYYMIIHKPTDTPLVLPIEGGYGFTRVGVGDEGVPRLFMNEAEARRALGQWLRGKCELRRIYMGDGEWDEEFCITNQPDRKKEEMAVVHVKVTTNV